MAICASHLSNCFIFHHRNWIMLTKFVRPSYEWRSRQNTFSLILVFLRSSSLDCYYLTCSCFSVIEFLIFVYFTLLIFLKSLAFSWPCYYSRSDASIYDFFILNRIHIALSRLQTFYWNVCWISVCKVVNLRLFWMFGALILFHRILDRANCHELWFFLHSWLWDC